MKQHGGANVVALTFESGALGALRIFDVRERGDALVDQGSRSCKRSCATVACCCWRPSCWHPMNSGRRGAGC